MSEYADCLWLGEWPDSYSPFVLPPEVYQWPMYALGLPGTGKSTLLANLALRLHSLGEGVLVIDTKDGDLAKAIAQRTPPEQLIYISPGACYFEGPYHWGLNPLEVPKRSREHFARVHSNVLSMLERMDRADYSIMTQVKYNLDLAIPLALYLPEPTLLDVRRILTEPLYRRAALTNPHIPQELRDNWERFNAMSERDQRQQVASTIPRLVDMLITPQRYFMFTQYHSTIRLQAWLDAGKMVVANFATGLDEHTGRTLGNVLLAMFMNEVFARENKSRIWRLVADEFDRLAGNNFAELIEKARSYRVFPIMAHQNLDQLKTDRGKNQSLYQSARSVPVVFNFRLSADDVYSMRRIHGSDYGDELSTLADYSAQLTLTRGAWGLVDPGQPVTLLLDPLQGEDNPQALENAVASQRAHTVSERLLKGATMEEHHEANTAHPLQQVRQPVSPGDDPTGTADPGVAQPLPSLDQLAGVQAPLPGESQQRGSNPKRQRRKSRNQPVLPQTPQGRGPGQGQADSQIGQPPDQVGDEPSDQDRPRGADKPSPGLEPLD